MLIDEPSIGLSPRLVQETFAILHELRSKGMSILMVEQNAKRGGARDPRRPEGRPAVSRWQPGYFLGLTWMRIATRSSPIVRFTGAPGTSWLR